METVGIFEAKTHLSELLERVAQGEAFTITRHGRPVAKLVPAIPERSQAAVSQAIDEMLSWRDTHGPRLGGLSIRELIEEGRR
jgi:prevent-host-death family protein